MGWVRHWDAARRESERTPRGAVLVFDEIQKIPNWSETVKGLWDADRAAGRPLHVVVLGSSPLRMQSRLTESLAGRFEPIRVSHWSFPEMADAFGLDLPGYLYFGGYPGAASLIRDPTQWRDFILRALIEPNIERDLLAMTRVDKPALLKRLFELGASCSGQILSYTKMLGQLQDAGNTHDVGALHRSTGERRTARGAAKIRQPPASAGIESEAHGAEHRSHDGQVRGIRSMRRAPTARSGDASSRARSGRICSIRRHRISGCTTGGTASTKSTSSWQRGPRLVAIEVKSGPRRGSLSGLEKFAELFQPQRLLFVGEGGVPLHEFLAAPAGHWCDEEP